jgi:hypothetical protein
MASGVMPRRAECDSNAAQCKGSAPTQLENIMKQPDDIVSYFQHRRKGGIYDRNYRWTR